MSPGDRERLLKAIKGESLIRLRKIHKDTLKALELIKKEIASREDKD